MLISLLTHGRVLYSYSDARLDQASHSVKESLGLVIQLNLEFLDAESIRVHFHGELVSLVFVVASHQRQLAAEGTAVGRVLDQRKPAGSEHHSNQGPSGHPQSHTSPSAVGIPLHQIQPWRPQAKLESSTV